MSLTLGVFALTAEAKAAEAAASAYYNPGNPHNVYMPTVRERGSASAATDAGSCRGKTAPCFKPSNANFPFLPSLEPAATTSLLPTGR